MITKQQAQEALIQIELTQQRSAELIGYWRSGIYVQVWGVVWIIAYLSCFFMPVNSGSIWLICDAIGGIATVILSIRDRKNEKQDKRITWAIVIIAAFGILVSTLISNRPGALPVFWTFLIMACYMLSGLWFGIRWIILGATVIALCMVTYLNFMPWFNLIMAIAGGGGLLLGGTWIARAK
ncbi:hypothetical protein [Solimicrobium silvestre]|uniref:Membrane protein (DUF2157) n=1 Tax=Solimicrobium silvestre TaxID=2099400 RepID=A0A2S9H4X4_9BURK|nr:hypothetical protein [Solimicrobium silvestre]PRC95017.1 hypothetical protein S2091_0212 [Solimicrobium silvestre]